jgi:hypothetical protein
VGVAISIAFLISPHTRGLGVFLLVLSGAIWIWSGAARRRGSLDPKEFVLTYEADAGTTFKALSAVVEALGYRDISSDAQQREVTFNTGRSRKTWAGQDFTGSVHAESPGISEVRLIGVTSQRGLGSVQSVSWGETEQLAHRVLDRLTKELGGSTHAIA